MRAIIFAAGTALAALSATASAQGEPPAAAAANPAGGCYIEIQRLMAEPPSGIGALGAAIRDLEVKLRPQVGEINELKAQMARLEQREVEADPSNSVEEAFEDDDEDIAPRQALPATDDRTAEEIGRVQSQLDARQAQLKLDYDAQRVAIIGPVQARVAQRVQAFATTRGCAQMKMARGPDLDALRTAAAQDVTGEFVTWYLANPSA